MEEKNNLKTSNFPDLSYWIHAVVFEGLIDPQQLDLSDQGTVYRVAEAIRFLQRRYLREYLLATLGVYRSALAVASSDYVQEIWDKVRTILEDLYGLYFHPAPKALSRSQEASTENTSADPSGSEAESSEPASISIDEIFRRSKTTHELAQNLQAAWEAYFGKLEDQHF